MPYYLNPAQVGISLVSAKGDGETVTIKWWRAFPETPGNKIAYNIYMDTAHPTFPEDFFLKSAAFVSIDSKLTADIQDLVPGQMYRFGVRPVEYDGTFDFTTLPEVNGLRVYPESPLRADMTASSLAVPLLSVDDFPATGTVRVGSELVQYSSVNSGTNNLILTSILQRGFHGTDATLHNTDGYDGYVFWDPTVLFFPIDSEDGNTVVFATQSRFETENFAFTLADGYRQMIKDSGNTDLSGSDATSADFPPYDYAGYHRTDPVALLNGECVGSYFGGQQYCADGYNSVGSMLRGISVDDINTQRQDQLLTIDGEPICLVRRQWLGIYCKCWTPTQEFPDSRCTSCYGTGRIVGYSQFFNPKRSDGRILMRFDPWIDDLALTDSGLDPEIVKPNSWTLVYPSIRKRDFIVRFDQEGNEEFRYEVINVTRNVLLTDSSLGAQKLSLQRIRKSDVIYQCKVFRDTSTMPSIISTSIASSLGILPHSHTIVRNEKNPATWNQLTSVSQGHNHIVSWDSDTGTLQVSEEVGHSHILAY